jgi:threonyl-tRNA synthetase
VIIPISEKFVDYAKNVLHLLGNLDIRARIDDRNEKTGKKIRDAELDRVPYMLIVGEKEEADQSVSVRKQGEGDLGSQSIQSFADQINEEIRKMIEK